MPAVVNNVGGRNEAMPGRPEQNTARRQLKQNKKAFYIL